jgi:hypothetical protein
MAQGKRWEEFTTPVPAPQVQADEHRCTRIYQKIILHLRLNNLES